MEEALNRRALLAMATLRMLPPALGRLHPRFGTPAAAIMTDTYSHNTTHHHTSKLICT